MDRRRVLMGLGSAALAACASPPPAQQPPNAILRHLSPVPPVRVERERILKTVVGLRPYRRGGFRLEEEYVAGKHLIHNYGHAGDGVSLSWGCSQIVAELAREANLGAIAILGAGVMGLTTGLILAGWGHEVTIYTDKVTPNTTSDIAGALILVPDDTEARIARLSHDGWEPYVARAGYGVKRVSHYFLGERGSASGSQGFLGRRVRESHSAVLVDPSIYLKQIMADFRVRGGKSTLSGLRRRLTCSRSEKRPSSIAPVLGPARCSLIPKSCRCVASSPICNRKRRSITPISPA